MKMSLAGKLPIPTIVSLSFSVENERISLENQRISIKSERTSIKNERDFNQK